jgi:hypothetical protein
MSFESQVQQWVSADNQLKLLNEKMKLLRQLKHDLTEKLKSHASQNDTLNRTINISDGRLRFANINTYEPLTFKYIAQSLGEIIHNPEQVKLIMNHLRENREVKVVSDLKRFSNNS